MRYSFAEIRRIRAELHEPEAGWSDDARAVMEEASGLVKAEERLLADLNEGSPLATYAPRLYERLKNIEARQTSSEDDDERDPK